MTQPLHSIGVFEREIREYTIHTCLKTTPSKVWTTGTDSLLISHMLPMNRSSITRVVNGLVPVQVPSGAGIEIVKK